MGNYLFTSSVSTGHGMFTASDWKWLDMDTKVPIKDFRPLCATRKISRTTICRSFRLGSTARSPSRGTFFKLFETCALQMSVDSSLVVIVLQILPQSDYPIPSM